MGYTLGRQHLDSNVTYRLSLLANLKITRWIKQYLTKKSSNFGLDLFAEFWADDLEQPLDSVDQESQAFFLCNAIVETYREDNHYEPKQLQISFPFIFLLLKPTSNASGDGSYFLVYRVKR